MCCVYPCSADKRWLQGAGSGTAPARKNPFVHQLAAASKVCGSLNVGNVSLCPSRGKVEHKRPRMCSCKQDLRFGTGTESGGACCWCLAAVCVSVRTGQVLTGTGDIPFPESFQCLAD